MKHVFLSLALLVLTFSVSAQSIPVNPKFGAVSDAEIDMTSYALDTSAVAVMLYRECQLDLVFNYKLEIVKELTVHERIKVLKEEGKRFADFSFLYVDDKVVKENYGGVKVETFNRENGKIVRTRMSKKYEFDEVYSDGVRRFSFTAENVKVGSVIEVTYKFTSPRYYDIDDLDIQLSIPVNQARELEKTIRTQYRIRILPPDGDSLSDSAILTIRALTPKDLSKETDGGSVSYVLGPFDDRTEVDRIVAALRADGLSGVSIF